jgi:ADP-heptose:LPS heptosyltransferase
MVPFKKILLLPMCGFGDAVCYLPFLEAVRENFPQAVIVCVVISESARAVLEAGGSNVTVIVFNRGGRQSGWRSLLAFLRRVRSFAFDVAVSGAHPDSHCSQHFPALGCASAPAPSGSASSTTGGS